MKTLHSTRLLPFLLFLPIFANAQFILNGNAVQINDTCWTLTTETDYALGSMWNEEKINLNESFEIKMRLNFGDKDGNGADGILFGLQPLGTSIGQAGEGLGFQGVSPSVGVEFDTYLNPHLGDPGFDHIAVIKNGIVDHGSSNNLAGPVKASPNSNNIEDGEWHLLLITWDAATTTLQVSFDGDLRLTYAGDIVNEVFGGDPEVFWGFTAATGGANNLQRVCLTCTIFRDELDDIVICPGGQFQINTGGGSDYEWTPATGLSNPNIPNPIASPDETTTYVVEISDACTFPIFDTLTVFVDGDTVFFDLGADTTYCQEEDVVFDATSFGADTVTYLWSNGATTPTISPLDSGIYSVTVTIDDYCMADDRVTAFVIPSPDGADLGVDTTLCLDKTLLLDATLGGNPTYEWPDGSSSPTFLVSRPGIYSVVISNQCGLGEATISVEYEDCRKIYFPNVFSPNGDGINDVFVPLDGGDVFQIRQMKVFDRWGGLLFENQLFLSSDFSAGWDGTARGELVPPGLYVWFAEVEFKEGTTKILEGEVSVVR